MHDAALTSPRHHSGTVIDPARGPAVAEMQRLSSFAEVSEVLKSRRFEHLVGHRDNAPILGGTLISLSGDQHFERRRISSQLFSAAANANYQTNVFMPAFETAIARWPRDGTGRARGDLFDALQQALSRLGAAIVGLDGVEGEEALRRHMAYTGEIANGVAIEFAERDHRSVISEALAHVERFEREFFEPSFARRQALVEAHAEGRISREELPLDLITLMLLHRRHYESYGPVTMLREAVFFNGAAGGVSHAVCNVISSLLAWVEDEPDSRRPLLKAPAFVRAAAMEGIRVKPATPYQIRRSTADHELDSGRPIRAGEYVMLDLAAANRDRTVFGEDADVFDPHRNPIARVKPTRLAFSDGAHTCIAMSLAAGDGQNFEEGRSGLLVAVLMRLFDLGITFEGADDARRKSDTLRSEYDAFPVSLAMGPPIDARRAR
ncbi:MAG: hypothetical protein BroJett024_39880 [Alphaproteobacteria bacterium]|nr:MAG: hypothetical protein BroJett024_39880 [Alphaproteobacteria bacterium]